MIHSELVCGHITDMWMWPMFVFIHTGHLNASSVSVSHSKVQINKGLHSLIWCTMSFHITFSYKNEEETLGANTICLAFIFLNCSAPNNENMKTRESVIVSFKWMFQAKQGYISFLETHYCYAAELLNWFGNFGIFLLPNEFFESLYSTIWKILFYFLFLFFNVISILDFKIMMIILLLYVQRYCIHHQLNNCIYNQLEMTYMGKVTII